MQNLQNSAQRTLGVNIDHIATLRQARGTRYPDPVLAAGWVEAAGAQQITLHVREDRRHVQERDVRLLRQTVQGVLNLEMAPTTAMLKLALEVRPDVVTLVPERREERTTEGGLDAVAQREQLKPMIESLHGAGMLVSLFIHPNLDQVRAPQRLGVRAVELHTGAYCDAPVAEQRAQLTCLADAAHAAAKSGMRVAAGHGLNYQNISAVLPINDIVEYNIGHSIIAQAVFVGLDRAVRDMLALLRGN